MRRRSEDTSAADTVLRLAVLLQAGVTPSRAWEHLADAGDPAAVRVAGALARGEPVSRAVLAARAPAPDPRRKHDPDPDWPDVAAA